MSNPTHYLMREVITPAHDDPDLQAARSDFERFQRVYEAKTVVVGDPVRVKRLPVGTGHLYYGDGREPCHHCDQPVGKPHLEGCDHEACAMCARDGHDVQLGCGRHEIAEHEVVLAGKMGPRRARVIGLGFTEAEAQADADRQWDAKYERFLRRYIDDAYTKLALAEERGLKGHVAGWERNIASAEQTLAKLNKKES